MCDLILILVIYIGMKEPVFVLDGCQGEWDFLAYCCQWDHYILWICCYSIHLTEIYLCFWHSSHSSQIGATVTFYKSNLAWLPTILQVEGLLQYLEMCSEFCLLCFPRFSPLPNSSGLVFSSWFWQCFVFKNPPDTEIAVSFILKTIFKCECSKKKHPPFSLFFIHIEFSVAQVTRALLWQQQYTRRMCQEGTIQGSSPLKNDINRSLLNLANRFILGWTDRALGI